MCLLVFGVILIIETFDFLRFRILADTDIKKFAKSKMTAKILCHSLELELFHKFVLCLVQRKNPAPVVC